MAQGAEGSRGDSARAGPGSPLPHTLGGPQARTQLCVSDSHVALQQIVHLLNRLFLKGGRLGSGEDRDTTIIRI
jgi:hypothetical protein